MSEPSQVWDAIEKRQFRRAWEIVDRVRQREPSHPYWMSVAAYICMNQGRRAECLRLAQTVLETKPSTETIVTILGQIFSEFRQRDQVFQLYDQALRKKAGSSAEDIVDLADQWTQACISLDYYKGINRAGIIASQKSDKREFAFQAVIGTCLSIKYDQMSNDNEKKIAAMVALRMLDKFSDLTSVDEKYVKAQALEYGAPTEKLVEYLMSKEITDEDSLDLCVMSVYKLRDAQKWSELCELCETQIKRAIVDSWLYWEWFIRSAFKLEQKQRVQAVLDASKSKSRNVSLSKCLVAELENDKKALVTAICEYLQTHGSKRCAYEDIYRYIDQQLVPVEEVFSWMSQHQPQEHEWALNLHKFQFVHNQTVHKVEELVAMYNKSLQGAKDKDPKDYHSGDDFVVLAVETLLASDQSSDALIKSAILLETVAENDKHQFYVRLWLVQIYMALGAYSLALGHYNTLSIKSAQIESLVHLMATRSSSVIPNASTIKNIDTWMRVYEQIYHVSHYTRYAYQKGRYIQLEGFHELHYKLENSLTRRMMELERVRAVRIIGKESPNTQFCERDYQLSVQEIQDNRDVKTWRGPLGNKVLGPHPQVNKEWIRAHLIKELLIRRFSGHHEDKQQLESELEDLLTTNNTFTAAEKSTMSIVIYLSRQQFDQVDAEVAAQKAAVSGDDTIKSTVEFVHNAFNSIESHNIVTTYMAQTKRSQTPKAIKQKASEMQKSAEDLWKQLRVFDTSVYNEWAESLDLSSESAQRCVADIIKSVSEGGVHILKNRK